MPSCRGLLISSRTSTARTLLADAIISHITGGRLWVVSAGGDVWHPANHFVTDVLSEVGVARPQDPRGLSSVLREGHTFDAMVSIADHDEEGAVAPHHWPVGSDEGTVSKRWNLWTPRNHKIFHENSVRKFQDGLYEGEPLFATKVAQRRRGLRYSDRWEMLKLDPRPMERPLETIQRYRDARDIIIQRSTKLVLSLEETFGENLTVNTIR